MHLHDESSEVLLPRTNDPSIQLACAGCGKTGVSICAKCAKTGYRKAVARANPLEKRDSELYGRLDKMSQLSLQEIKPLWDEFCIEINAENFYEHLPIFVEILQEGNWRTDALDVRRWLRGNLAKRVKRLCGPEDYGPAVASVDEQGRPVISRTRRPSGLRFDKRDGTLIAFGTQPYTEFEVEDGDGKSMTSEEAVDYYAAQTAEDEDGDIIRVMPDDRYTPKFLREKTWAEWFDCAPVFLLREDRPEFDKLLAQTISDGRVLATRMGLDQDEAEALAVTALLWSHGPRAYLNFLDGPNKKRVRNAFDRISRRLRNPEWQSSLRKALRELASETRSRWNKKYWDDYYRRTERRGWRHLIVHDVPPKVSLWPACKRCNHILCVCGVIGGTWTSATALKPPRLDSSGVVTLACDIPPKEKRLHNAYIRKHNG